MFRDDVRASSEADDLSRKFKTFGVRASPVLPTVCGAAELHRETAVKGLCS
jgi:hypothetical protein